jgi:hypothetical protein
MASQLGGDQYAGHLALLWNGTHLAPSAAQVGMLVGRVGMVAKDIQTNDNRFFSMSPAHQASVVAWACEALEELQGMHLKCSAFIASYARSILESRRATPRGPQRRSST